MAAQSLLGQNNKPYSQQNWKRNLRSAQEGNDVQAENSLDQERQVDRLRGTFANLRNSVLVLGDGNLSFSLALGYLFPKKNILATVLESRKQFVEKFIIAGQANLEQLKNFCPNVHVMFEIDASNINKRRLLEKCPFFTDIVMNFPHHGGKTNLKKSKELLREIFRSVSQCLMLEESTRFHVTLAKGQSGINPAYIRKGIYFLDDEIPEHNKDSWRLMDIAADAGLRVEYVDVFRPEQFTGYDCTGYKDREQMFHNKEDSETFTLVKAYHLDVRLRLDFAKFMEGANQMYRGYELRNMPKFLCTYHVYRPIYKRDISISFGHKLRNYMDQIEPMIFTLIRENVALRTEEPNKPLNRIYQVYFQGWQIPISKMMCKTFLNDFLGQLGQAFDASKDKGGIGCGVTLETRVCD